MNALPVRREREKKIPNGQVTIRRKEAQQKEKEQLTKATRQIGLAEGSWPSLSSSTVFWSEVFNVFTLPEKRSIFSLIQLTSVHIGQKGSTAPERDK